MFDSNPLELFTYYLKELGKRGIAFVECMNYEGSHVPNLYDRKPEDDIKDLFKTLR